MNSKNCKKNALMESEDEFGAEEDSELDSDEEATTEIALNVDEKYLHNLHSLLHSPIADFSPPFSPPIQQEYHQLANNNIEDESFWLPPPMAMISKGKTLPPPANLQQEESEKMSFGYSPPSPPANVLLNGLAPPSMATPIGREEDEEEEGKKDTAFSSSHLPTTSSATSSHQQQQQKSSSSEAAPSPSSHHSQPPQPLTNNPNQQQLPNSSTTSQSPAVVVRQRPAIPPKPQLDIVRFSMAQARDECDLDTILSELLELENQLSGEIGNQMVLGLPALLPAGQKATGAIQSEMMPSTQPQPPICAAPIEQMAKRVQFQQFANQSQTDSSAMAMARLPPSSTTNGSREGGGFLAGIDFCCISPDADSAFGDSSSTESAHPPIHHKLTNNGTNLGGNGQNGRNNVGGGERGSEFSSADSFRGSLNTTPSPTNHQQTNGLLIGQISSQGHCQNGGGMPPPPGNRPPSSADSFVSTVSKDEQKKAKIREALEKMKEAKMKKVFVKIFLEDGSQRGVLLDERWTVAETMRQLAEKIPCLLTPEHAIVEEYPHLHIKRAYEDHEFVVENLEDWTADSPNKLHFVRCPQKWTLFRHPQLFLLTDRNRAEFPDQKAQWDGAEKAKLLEEYLQEDSGTSRVPELEGWLMLKADGKKSWRRHFFVLRASGLYYVAKPGKPRGPTRDLTCLMSVFNNQVYICTDWRKKYKAPSDWGFAIKHPRIQVKTSKYIKYICAEDETTFLQWITALRIIKNGCPILHKNFCAISTQPAGHPHHHHLPHHYTSTSTLASSSAGGCPGTPAIRVQVPQVPLQRLSALDPSANQHLLGQSPRHQPQKVFFAQQNGIGSYNSPAMTRASFAAISNNSSRCNGGESTNSSRLDSPIHVSFAFDQDQCNTIKRQPDSLATNGTQQQHFPPPASIRHFDANYGARLGTPTTSNGNSNNNSSILLGNGAESDSDEEQFPPPPPNERTPTNGNTAIFVHAESPRRMITTNGAAPQCPPKPTAIQLANISPWKTASNSPMMATPEFASTPPPPPKRADGTRIQTIGGGIDDGGMNGGQTRNVQMLMAELQLATNKQKMRLEQNL